MSCCWASSAPALRHRDPQLGDGLPGQLATDRLPVDPAGDRDRPGIGLITWLILPVPFALAFAFGAVVAPPDAVAATTIARRVGMPRQLVTILEGESLLNDATAITCVRVGLVAIASTVTAGEVAAGFAVAAVGGVLVGFAVAALATAVRKRITRAGLRHRDLVHGAVGGLPAGRGDRVPGLPRLGGDRDRGRRADPGSQVGGGAERAVTTQRAGQLGHHPVPAGEHGLPADRSAGPSDHPQHGHHRPPGQPDRRLLPRGAARRDDHPDGLGAHRPSAAAVPGQGSRTAALVVLDRARLGGSAWGGDAGHGTADPDRARRPGRARVRGDDRGGRHAAHPGADAPAPGATARSARPRPPLRRPAGGDGPADGEQRGADRARRHHRSGRRPGRHPAGPRPDRRPTRSPVGTARVQRLTDPGGGVSPAAAGHHHHRAG